MAAAPGVDDSGAYSLMRRKVFVEDPNHSGSGEAATSGKHRANEAQRALSAQQEGNYNVIPTFNIITIFIALQAGQEQRRVRAEYGEFGLITKMDEPQNIHIRRFLLFISFLPRQFISEIRSFSKH